MSVCWTQNDILSMVSGFLHWVEVPKILYPPGFCDSKRKCPKKGSAGRVYMANSSWLRGGVVGNVAMCKCMSCGSYLKSPLYFVFG